MNQYVLISMLSKFTEVETNSSIATLLHVITKGTYTRLVGSFDVVYDR